MAETLALALSKNALDMAQRVMKARLRLHNADAIQDNMDVVFVVPRYSRIETILLPFVLRRHFKREVWGLAPADDYNGRLAAYLRSADVVHCVEKPPFNTTIVHALLTGQHPWIVFPAQGRRNRRMLLRGPVAATTASLELTESKGPVHEAGRIALHAELARQQLEHLRTAAEAGETAQEAYNAAREAYGLTNGHPEPGRRTVVVPLRVTYYPVHPSDETLLRLARVWAREHNHRKLGEGEALAGTVFDTTGAIDIRFGEPIDVAKVMRDFGINAPRMGPAHEERLEPLLGPVLDAVARRGANRWSGLTTTTYDHVFSVLMRFYTGPPMTVRAWRRRVFLAVEALRERGCLLQDELSESAARLLYDDPDPVYDEAFARFVKRGILRQENGRVVRNETRPLNRAFASAEAALPESAMSALRTVARQAGWTLARRTRRHFATRDTEAFEYDYAYFFEEGESKAPDVGRPFLLRPLWPKGGIVLAHGYMAAPLEVRAMAEYFYRQNYAVYGVRLRGHGTSPLDLATRQWEEWYDALNHGYGVLRGITDQVSIGGFSTGGCLALLAGARKGLEVQSVFAICAPLQLRNYTIRLVPTIVTMNNFLRKLGRTNSDWEYVQNLPENRHINYTRNPLAGLSELMKCMEATTRALPSIQAPTLVVQASKDPTVDPISASQIFENVGTPHKEMVMIERTNHGIVNGAGSQQVFARVHQWLQWATGIRRSMDA